MNNQNFQLNLQLRRKKAISQPSQCKGNTLVCEPEGHGLDSRPRQIFLTIYLFSEQLGLLISTLLSSFFSTLLIQRPLNVITRVLFIKNAVIPEIHVPKLTSVYLRLIQVLPIKFSNFIVVLPSVI